MQHEIRQPLLLSPVGKDYLWGGTRLKTEYNKALPLSPLAETWECSLHPDGPSVIRSGSFKGMTLSDFLSIHPEYMGDKFNQNFPILVKFIDAQKDLSVQVHPTDEYAKAYENQNGKTEFWYVLDAQPGARLICGFAHDVTPDILRHAIRTGTLNKHMQWVPVHKGDVFFIPAGTIHAIGAGILIAEIQESSNATYRVYDYDRTDKNGNKRELHFEKAIQVLNMKSGTDVRQKPRRVNYSYGSSSEILCRCRYFDVERIQSLLGFDFTVLNTSFQVLLCLDGDGVIISDGMKNPLHFNKGDCIFVPADCGRCHVLGKCELLKIRC